MDNDGGLDAAAVISGRQFNSDSKDNYANAPRSTSLLCEHYSHVFFIGWVKDVQGRWGRGVGGVSGWKYVT